MNSGKYVFRQMLDFVNGRQINQLIDILIQNIPSINTKQDIDRLIDAFLQEIIDETNQYIATLSENGFLKMTFLNFDNK